MLKVLILVLERISILELVVLLLRGLLSPVRSLVLHRVASPTADCPAPGHEPSAGTDLDLQTNLVVAFTCRDAF
jgi:hypothetical protein